MHAGLTSVVSKFLGGLEMEDTGLHFKAVEGQKCRRAERFETFGNAMADFLIFITGNCCIPHWCLRRIRNFFAVAYEDEMSTMHRWIIGGKKRQRSPLNHDEVRGLPVAHPGAARPLGTLPTARRAPAWPGKLPNLRRRTALPKGTSGEGSSTWASPLRDGSWRLLAADLAAWLPTAPGVSWRLLTAPVISTAEGL